MTFEIIGCAAIAPGAPTVSELRAILKDGRCTVTEIPPDRWDLARFWHPEPGTGGKTYTFAAGVIDDPYAFDPGVFGLSVREAMQMDPQQRLMLTLVWRALEDAALPPDRLGAERVGVYIGASALDQANLSSEDPASGGPYFMTGNTLSIVSNRVSHVFGFRGPSFTIDTACSSSLFALHQATRDLAAGDVDTAIVGGVSILAHPLSFVGFAQARMLSPAGQCRAFDEKGQGYVRSEGGVALIVRRSDHAEREGDRSRARLHATAVNASGRTTFISLPTVEAQTALLKTVYEDHGIDVNRLAFIETHGTGTKAGDPVEARAIGDVIGRKRRAPLPVGSIKTNIGHTEPASGLFGVVKAILALENNFLPASLHFENPNTDIDFEGLNICVNSTTVDLLPGRKPRFAGVNSFGFGGANAHVVLSDPDRPPHRPPAKAGRDALTFVASAHTPGALSMLVEAYRRRLETAEETEAARIAGAASANRPALRHRFAVRAKDRAGVIDAITACLRGDISQGETGEAPGPSVKTAFVFSGNGCQWAGMGRDACRENARFRQAFQSFSTLFENDLGERLTDLLDSDDLSARLTDTRVAQPLLFSVQAALCDTLATYRLRPDVVFGHSVGEVAAAYAAKALTADEAVMVIARRSHYQDQLAGEGKMAAVSLGEGAALDFARRHELDSIHIGAVNAPNAVTITGSADDIHAFRDLARKAHIPAHVLDINYPFHHPLIDRAKDAFLADMPQISPESGACSFLSTVTGDDLDGACLNAAYWWRNVRDPVLFHQAADRALTMGCTLFVEIGPRPILGTYISQIARHRSIKVAVVPSLLRETTAPGFDPVSKAFARAVANGAPLPGPLRRDASVPLPPLPMEPASLKMPPSGDGVDLFGRGAATPCTLLGWRADPNGSHWKNHIDARLFPDLADHVVDGKPILPGAAFIEIAVTAARRHLGTATVEIGNLEILRALDLRDDRLTELSTLISPETGLIEIRSRDLFSEDDWVTHAVARIRTPTDTGRRPDPAPPPQGDAVIDPARAYATAARFHLSYGPAFRLLETAAVSGGSRIDVTLKAPEAPAHPYIRYDLDPRSVDAAFHGLVALFDQFSAAEGGAPYIPVRFGTIRVFCETPDIARAVIDVEKASPFGLKARIHLFDRTGRCVASLDDARFRKTFLRRPQGLESVTFHYEAVPASPSTRLPDAAVGGLFPAPAPEAPGTATLLLDAAVYRAACDLLVMSARKDRRISLRTLPKDPVLKRFLKTCLHALEDAGLAAPDTDTADTWRLPSTADLPPVSDLLQDLVRTDPSRAAEGLLLNETRRQAAEALAKSGTAPFVFRCPDATVDHVLTHSPLERRRTTLLFDAARQVFQVGAPRRVLEVGSTSPAFSRRLAALCAAHGASLTVVEEADVRRRALTIALGRLPSVRVVSPAELDDAGAFDLMIVGGMTSRTLLVNDRDGRRAAHISAARGARLILAARLPSVYNDFAFGLMGDAGATAAWTADLLEETLRSLGFGAVASREIVYPEGALLVADAQGTPANTDANPQTKTDSLEDAAQRLEDAVVYYMAEDPAAPFPLTHRRVICLPPGDDPATLLAALDGHSATAPHILYATAPSDRDASDRTLDRLAWLAALVEALRRWRQDRGERNADTRPRLVVLARGGAPVAGAATDPANAGLWCLGRVLQNEVDGIDIHLVDVAEPQAVDAVLETVFSTPSPNREWVLSDPADGLREIRAAQGPKPDIPGRTEAFAAAILRQEPNVRFDDLTWEETERPVAGPDEVVVRVEAGALNFRDVMWVMGLLPEEALEDGFAGPSVGMEFSGVVIDAGTGVPDLRRGDRVMGIGPAAFATHVRVRRDGVALCPPGVDPIACATAPVAFLTAWYAMVELGRLTAGETLLIHGAAGGLGLAAIQIARLRGATIIATAGSPEKRSFLTMMGVDHVLDSRSLAFFDDVRRLTGGEGVDMVLNALFAEAMERSLELVKPFGRFLELGKRDYYADRKIGLRPFRRNVSYFGIDADQLLVSAPDLARRLFTDIAALFADGRLSPLPYRTFEADEVAEAFRLMQQSGHVGKILVKPPRPGRDRLAPRRARPPRFDADGVYLVAGGIGGFGLQAAAWLADHGVRRIALCSRRGRADAETKEAIRRWKKNGVLATVHACDITDRRRTAALLDSLRAEAPLKGVVHAAMVLDDGLLANLDRRRNRPVVAVKIKGAEVLDALTASDDLDLFLLFSSATTLIGNPGQANYVAANGFLEGLARARRARGQPALAVAFGAIADAGVLTRDQASGDRLARRIGKTALKARDALDRVGDVLRQDDGRVDAAAVVIADVDWTTARLLPIAATGLLEAPLRTAGGHRAGDGDRIDLQALIHGLDPDQAQAALHTVLRTEIAAILRVAEETITPDAVFRDIGLDSLMAMELMANFEEKTGADIPLGSIGDATTMGDVAARLHQRLLNRTGDAARTRPGGDGERLTARLIQSHAAANDVRSARRKDGAA